MLRDYYFKGIQRAWKNDYATFTTGAPWGDYIWNEEDFYIVPEAMGFMGVNGKGLFGQSLQEMAIKVELPQNFWELSLPERRATFLQIVMLDYIPHEIISHHDLLAGGRFNTQLSKCLNAKEYQKIQKENLQNRHQAFRYHVEGFGNLGATGGHLIVNYEKILKHGFKALYNQIQVEYERLTEKDKNSALGNELRAMQISAETPRKLALKYQEECQRLITETEDPQREQELTTMAKNLSQVPWEPAETYWQALQAIWLTHMLIIAEESYPGPGTSFGRLDQYLFPHYKRDVLENHTITRAFAQDLFSTFIFHCNTAYDAQIRVGKQGITSGYGQLLTMSGLLADGTDATNELTYLMLETFDQWAPILEPKPNVRLHRNSPDKLYDVIIDMISRAQGAPFILNFDERSMAGLIREGVAPEDVWDYGCVGCLENTMCGNDRSGTVNCNPNLAKSIELTLWNGKNQPRFKRVFGDGTFKQTKKGTQFGPKTGNPENFSTWTEFFNAWRQQMAYLIKYTTTLYNRLEQTRASYFPTPYVSILMDGMIEQAKDLRQAPPKYGFITIEGVAYATLVDSLLAIKKFVYDDKKYTIGEMKQALLDNFSATKEQQIMQAMLKNKTPKYGTNTDETDEFSKKIMAIWAEETWQYTTPTGFQFRPGMLSWNYWAGEDAAFTPATPDGRSANTFLSNAICPTNGTDMKGPTAVTNSVGAALGGKTKAGEFLNVLPNGASHTITFNPSILKDQDHKDKFKSYLKGYVENGGTALQINILDAEMLKDAQSHPENYQNLMVRVTGYNAYFTAIGKELQDEIISRETHQM